MNYRIFRTPTPPQRTKKLARLKERLDVLAPKLMDGQPLKKLVTPLSEMAKLNPNGVQYSFSVTDIPQVDPGYSFLAIKITDGMGMGDTTNPGLSDEKYPFAHVTRISAGKFRIDTPAVIGSATTPSALASLLLALGNFLASYAPTKLEVE